MPSELTPPRPVSVGPSCAVCEDALQAPGAGKRFTATICCTGRRCCGGPTRTRSRHRVLPLHHIVRVRFSPRSVEKADVLVLRRPLGPTDTTLLNASQTTAISAGSFITGLMGVLSRPFPLRSKDHEDVAGAQHCDSLVGYTDQRRLDELAEAHDSSTDDNGDVSDEYCPESRRPAAVKKATFSRKARPCPRTSKHYVLLTGPLSKVNVRTSSFCQGKLYQLILLFGCRAPANLTLRIYTGRCRRQVFPPTLP